MNQEIIKIAFENKAIIDGLKRQFKKNGKIYPIVDAYIVKDMDNNETYTVRIEDTNLPYVVGSNVVYSIDKDGFAIIHKCETIAEIHSTPNTPIGWICPKCNKSNAPFIKKCDC